jgi:hypothetical protein
MPGSVIAVAVAVAPVMRWPTGNAAVRAAGGSTNAPFT